MRGDGSSCLDIFEEEGSVNCIGTPINVGVVLSQPRFAEDDIKRVQGRDDQCAFFLELWSEEERNCTLVDCGGDGTICQLDA